MKLLGITIGFILLTRVLGEIVIPECMKSCVSILDKAGCGPLTQETVRCFCDKKHLIINEAQNCIIESRACTLAEILAVRNSIIASCGSF